MEKTLAELVQEDNSRPVSERGTAARSTQEDRRAVLVLDEPARENFARLLRGAAKPSK